MTENHREQIFQNGTFKQYFQAQLHTYGSEAGVGSHFKRLCDYEASGSSHLESPCGSQKCSHSNFERSGCSEAPASSHFERPCSAEATLSGHIGRLWGWIIIGRPACTKYRACAAKIAQDTLKTQLTKTHKMHEALRLCIQNHPQ